MNRIISTLAALIVVCPIDDPAMAQQRSAMSPEEAKAIAKEAGMFCPEGIRGRIGTLVRGNRCDGR